MLLDLREIVGIPGASLSFEYAPDLQVLLSDSVIGIEKEPYAEGCVENGAGVLTLTAKLDASLKCVCARCLREFSKDMSKTVRVYLSENEAAEEDPEYYYISADALDPDEIIPTELLLGLEAVQLCDPDCKGLCPKCGKNLNEGDCGCKPDIDPRLAKLSKLLDDGRDAD